MTAAHGQNDVLTVEGLGGLYNGEVFVLKPGESGTLGATSLATFPVTLCRNYRRLASDPSREELLTRLAPEHVRLVYLGRGRLLVESLPDTEVLVGWRPVRDPFDVDLAAGRVEIGFGYGERVVASFPGSPDTFQEFAAHRDEAAEVEGVFMALLAPDGPLAGIAARLAERADTYELVEAGEERAYDPERDTGEIPEIEPPPAWRERRRRRGRFWPFRSGPALLLSALFHLVVVLGLYAWIRREAATEPVVAEVRISTWPAGIRTPPPAIPAPPDPIPDPAVGESPAAEPVIVEGEADRDLGNAPGESGDAGAGAAAVLGVGAGGPGGPEAGTGVALAAGRPGGATPALRDGAMARALDWLARHQLPDGSWRARASLEACGRCPDPGKRDYPIATTGLALLAFASAGQTHRDGEWSESVARGVRFLAGEQREDGSFHPRTTDAEERPVYGDAIATSAFADLYGRSRSPLLRAALVRAVRFLVREQEPYAGWRYVPGSRETDTSVTAWAYLGISLAERAGVGSSPAVAFGVLSWLDEVTEPGTFRVGYRVRGRGSPGMSAAGLLIRLRAGRPASDPAVRAARDLLRETPPSWPASGEDPLPGNPPDMLYWYFASLASRELGDPDARAWARAVREVLDPRQETSGEARGSWPPAGAWTRVGGRVMATALAVMTGVGNR